MSDGTRFAVFYNAFGSNSIDLKVLPTSYAQWLAGGNRNAVTAGGVLDRILGSDQAGTATTAQDKLLYVAASQNAATLPGFARALAGEVHAAMAAAAPQAGLRVNNTVIRQLGDTSVLGAAPATTTATTSERGRRGLWWTSAPTMAAGTATAAPRNSPPTARSSCWARTCWAASRPASASASRTPTPTSAPPAARARSRSTWASPTARARSARWWWTAWPASAAMTGIPSAPIRPASSTALKTDASGNSTQVGIGLRTPLALGATTLEPFARFLWQKSTRGATDEGSATPAALSLGRYDATGNRVTLGLTARSAQRSPLSDTLTYQFSAGIGRDNGNLAQTTVQANLAGYSMGIVSPQVGRLFGQASFTGTLRLGKQAYAYLGLNGEVRRGKNDVGVNGGLRVAF